MTVALAAARTWTRIYTARMEPALRDARDSMRRAHMILVGARLVPGSTAAGQPPGPPPRDRPP